MRLQLYLTSFLSGALLFLSGYSSALAGDTQKLRNLATDRQPLFQAKTHITRQDCLTVKRSADKTRNASILSHKQHKISSSQQNKPILTYYGIQSAFAEKPIVITGLPGRQKMASLLPVYITLYNIYAHIQSREG